MAPTIAERVGEIAGEFDEKLGMESRLRVLIFDRE
jgi:hypothetical protein